MGPDHWYPLGSSALLAAGTVQQAFLLDRELAMWRSASGRLRVWDNRCPHRSVRLSLGFVQGEMLGCRYHGWRYGADGRCVAIPAHPGKTPPPSACVRAFPAVESAGLVWTSPGEPVEAAPPGLDESFAYFRSYRLPAGLPLLCRGAERCGWSLTQPLLLHHGDLAGRRAFAVLQPLGAESTCVHVLLDARAAIDTAKQAVNAIVRDLLLSWLPPLPAHA